MNIIKLIYISVRIFDIPFIVLFVINIIGYRGKKLIIEEKQFNSNDFDIKNVQINLNIKSNDQTN